MTLDGQTAHPLDKAAIREPFMRGLSVFALNLFAAFIAHIQVS